MISILINFDCSKNKYGTSRWEYFNAKQRTIRKKILIFDFFGCYRSCYFLNIYIVCFSFLFPFEYFFGGAFMEYHFFASIYLNILDWIFWNGFPLKLYQCLHHILIVHHMNSMFLFFDCLPSVWL